VVRLAVAYGLSQPVSITSSSASTIALHERRWPRALPLTDYLLLVALADFIRETPRSATVCYDLTSKSLEARMSDPSTTTLSSRGQVVIPQEIRERLRLEPGTRFVVIAENDVVVFKVLAVPTAEQFEALISQARAVAREEGLRPADARRAVREARRKA
jgi:AbrB family looped-hinge helix DNA binding protein